MEWGNTPPGARPRPAEAGAGAADRPSGGGHGGVADDTARAQPFKGNDSKPLVRVQEVARDAQLYVLIVGRIDYNL